MFRVESETTAPFEFEWRGAEHSVPQLAALPMDDLMAFSEAAERGETAAVRWMYDLFMRETDGAVADMPASAFGQLAKAWQAARAVEAGK